VNIMDSRNLLIVAILIVIVVLVAIFAFVLPHGNDDGKVATEINFLSPQNLKNGEAVEFQLKDTHGNVIAKDNITIKFEENGQNQTYSIVTDEEGKGSLVLNNENPGTYNVYVLYNGSASYSACQASQTITIEEGTASNTNSTTGNSSAGTSLYNGQASNSSNLHYDSEYNFYYDDNGIIRGGQDDGMSADYIRNAYSSGNMIDEEGNLQ